MKPEKLELSERVERRLAIIPAHKKQGGAVRCVIEAFSVSIGTSSYGYHRYENEEIFGLFDSTQNPTISVTNIFKALCHIL